MAPRGMNDNEEDLVVTSSRSRNTSAQKFSVDATKPMVAQVGHLGSDYDEWVHEPVMRKESPRIYESKVLELITRCKWWMIPAVWGPVVVWCQAKAMERGLPTSVLPVAFLVGFLFWTFLEYVIHRFVFHAKSSSAWRNQLHYVVHGFHHKHPMDADRLVFPPVYTAAVAIVIWKVMELVLAPSWMPSIFGGALFGYICYDLTHYFLHFGTAFTDYLYKLKKDHFNHHFKTGMHRYGFGVTTSFWDAVFGTLPPVQDTQHRGPMIAGQAMANSTSPAWINGVKCALNNNNSQE